MKRRNFLGMFGAAATAPLIPTVATATPIYSRTAFSRAVMHARLRPHVSARGIAHRLKLSLPQAEGMIAEMASKGMVRPIAGGGGVHMRAMSAIVKPQTWGTGAAVRNARANAATSKRAQMVERPSSDPTPLMAHLHSLCEEYGMTLGPAAYQPQAILA